MGSVLFFQFFCVTNFHSVCMRVCFNIFVEFKVAESDWVNLVAKVLFISVAANLFIIFHEVLNILQEPAQVGLIRSLFFIQSLELS